MMDKPKFLYIVQSSSGRTLHIWAASSNQAKRARKPRTKIYYCHPYSAYERGSNENMNRIIRRFFPKGTSFDEVTAAEVAEVEEWLANYPRRILGWATPQMLFERYIT